MLSGGGEGPTPFCRREALRGLCPSLRKNMGVNLSVVLRGRDSPLQSPPFLCVGCVCVCKYTLAGVKDTGTGDKDKTGMKEQSPNSPAAPSRPPPSVPPCGCWRETRGRWTLAIQALLGREPHHHPCLPPQQESGGSGHQAFLELPGTGASWLRRKAAPLSGFTGPTGVATWQQLCGSRLCTQRHTLQQVLSDWAPSHQWG